MRSLTFAMLFATISTSAIASTNYTQDARDLSAVALCGATNTSCQTGYKTGATSTAASKRLETAYRAIRAAEVPPAPPPPAPVPVPPPPPPAPPPPAPTLSGVVSEGDSISVVWNGNHVGLYASSRPDITVKGLAVGGSGLNNLIARRQAVLDLKPKVFTVLIGANDLSSYATGNTYCAAVLAYIGPVRALGSKVAVGTILPQSLAGFNAKRLEANACFRAAVGSTIDGVYDFDTVTIPLQADGVHPTDAGQAVMAPVYKRTVDGLLSGAPAPVPPPSPPPAPPPVDTTIPTTGLAIIPSNFDVNSELVPAWGSGAIPPSAAPDVVGAFRFICNAGQLSYDDPIVYPGQPGKSHLHQYFGNLSANADSTYQSLRTTGNSSCMSPLNRSGYWMPAMMNDKGQVIRPDYVSIYYKRRIKSDPLCAKIGKACVDLPRGLRFIFGYNMLNMADKPTGGGYFNCDGTGAIPGHYKTLVTAQANCPVTARIGAVISAPECWDGKNLDSADHRSHVAYSAYIGQSYAQCPATHPYVIPTFTLGAWFSQGAVAEPWHLSSDVMPDGTVMTAGTTFHADWFGAWSPEVQSMWQDNCINLLLNCSGGDLGNGLQMRMFAGFSYVANPRLVPVPVRP